MCVCVCVVCICDVCGVCVVFGMCIYVAYVYCVVCICGMCVVNMYKCIWYMYMHCEWCAYV